MPYLMLFLAGALLCNALPHLVAGLQGRLFPTPFATPRGVGFSPPWLNFIWGFANLALACVLIKRRFAGGSWDVSAVACGILLAGLYLSIHFNKVRIVHRSKDA